MRHCSRVRRASTPRRIQASSCASSLSNFSLTVASWASCSALRCWKAAKLPGNEAEPAAVQLDHAGGHAVEKGAIVRDEQQRAREIREQLLEPLDRFDVEVIGGLVEQHQLGLDHQGAGQRRALLLPAGQLLHARVQRQMQAREHHLDPRLDAPAVAATRAGGRAARGARSARRRGASPARAPRARTRPAARCTSPRPSAAASKTVWPGANCGSCGTWASRSSGMRQTTPSSAAAAPATMRSRLLLPVPLRPISATLSPASRLRST